MGTNFLYLKVNTNNAFDNSINPQFGNAIIYLTKDINNNLLWMAKDQNGEYYQLGILTNENAKAAIAQIVSINEDGTLITNSLSYENGIPYLNNDSNNVSAYTFSGVPIAINVQFPDNTTEIFYLQNLYAKNYNRIWSTNNKKIYYNIAYSRWHLEDILQSTLIDYTTTTCNQPYDSTWANGSEISKQ